MQERHYLPRKLQNLNLKFLLNLRKKVNAKHIINNDPRVKSNDEIVLITNGNDEKEAHNALISYIENNFKIKTYQTLKGIVASSGIAIGKAKFIVDNKSIEIFNKYSTESEAELIRFRKAIIEATKKNRSYKKRFFFTFFSRIRNL